MKYIVAAIGAALLTAPAVGGATAQTQQPATTNQYQDLDDISVVTGDGTRIGEIDSVALGQDGTLAYVLEIEEGFMGMRDKEVVVPMDRLSFDAKNNRFTTDLAEADFQNLQTWDD